ncbi:hypothetical protein PS1_029681 [Malus domestica]
MRTRFMDMRYKIGPRESAKKVVVSPAILSKYQPSDRLTPWRMLRDRAKSGGWAAFDLKQRQKQGLEP